MKHNPKLHERLAALPGNARLHPLQDPSRAQGALRLMFELQGALAEIAGLPYVSLQPSAGSHGELAGLLLTRAYHEDRGQRRTKVLTPDTAHGTNPATVTLAGYDVVKLGIDARGNVDLDDLRAKATDDVACLMLTNPSTLGLFETGIAEIAEIVHGIGATLYYDGCQPRRDHRHLPPRGHGLRHRPFQPAQDVHATTRWRRARRGANRGIGTDRAIPAAPASRSPRDRRGQWHPEAALRARPRRPKSIGRLRGFQGNYGVFVRSYAYILSMGADGLRDASATAVLNANYLLAKLRDAGVAEHLPAAYDRLCMHEFVLSGAPMKRELQIRSPRPRQAPARITASIRRPCTSRCGRGGPDDRADRDRDQGDARRVRSRSRRDPPRGERGPGDSSQRTPHDPSAQARRGDRRQAPIVRQMLP